MCGNVPHDLKTDTSCFCRDAIGRRCIDNEAAVSPGVPYVTCAKPKRFAHNPGPQISQRVGGCIGQSPRLPYNPYPIEYRSEEEITRVVAREDEDSTGPEDAEA